MGALESMEFFAPTASNRWDFLFEDYQQTRAEIARIAARQQDPTHRAAMAHFLSAARRNDRGITALPDEADAVRELDASYWQKAIRFTDVLDYMPAKARDEWHESIRAAKTPPFEPDTVRATMADLLGRRADFLADMVDGIFRGLSGEHVTNRPEGFYKRMIFSGVSDYSSYGTTGLVRDLRMVVGKIMQRGDTPNWSCGSDAIRYADRTIGQWVTLDGGALRLRTYLKRTAHIEVHPQIAWRLNTILAHRYPMAIPPKFRAKPARSKKAPLIYNRPLPWPVIGALSGLNVVGDRVHFSASLHDIDKALKRDVESVLAALGGARNDSGAWVFDYPPGDALAEVAQSGVIPDKASHQYYPTPADIAEQMVALASIRPGDTCLEPSAGTGAIARLLPQDTTTCVEIAAAHAAAIRAAGYACYQADFLSWSSPASFDAVVMNPPYSQGRWKAHLLHAASMLAPGGRLVALLPAAARNDSELQGAGAKWVGVPGTFPGTSMEVVICEMARPTEGGGAA